MSDDSPEGAEADTDAPADDVVEDAAEPVDLGRARLRAALWNPSRAQAVVAVLLAGVGFAVVTQVQSNRVDDSFATYREQDLIDVLNGLAGASQRSQAEIDRLEQTRDDLESDTDKRQAALEQAQGEASALSILAGLVPVTGPGIEVTITEVDGRVMLGSVIDLVQELRTDGAESIQVGGRTGGDVRLVAQSSLEDAVPGLVVDGVQLTSPYTVTAIGDPDLLAGAVVFADGPRSQLEDDGARVQVDKLTSLDVTSVRTTPVTGSGRPDK